MAIFLHYRYAAIRRYGARRWTVQQGAIEINTNYVVSVGQCEITGIYDNGTDRPFFIELSNGTKLLVYFHGYGTGPEDELLGKNGEAANCAVDPDVYGRISFYMLNQ